MKEVLFLGVAGILGVGFYIQNPFGETNVYNLPAEEMYKRLSAIQVEPSGTGPYGRLDTTTSGVPSKSVTWHASGSHANFKCTVFIEPRSETKTALNATCGGGGPSDGAAAGMVRTMHRKATIELVDSALDGRPYDPAKAEGATAYGWPADPNPQDGLSESVDKAMEMDRDMQRMLREAEKNKR